LFRCEDDRLELASDDDILYNVHFLKNKNWGYFVVANIYSL
jgi:hypothetical protein